MNRNKNLIIPIPMRAIKCMLNYAAIKRINILFFNSFSNFFEYIAPVLESAATKSQDAISARRDLRKSSRASSHDAIGSAGISESAEA
jgi:hypothetical protein